MPIHDKHATTSSAEPRRQTSEPPAAGRESRRDLLKLSAAALAAGALRLRMPALAGAQDAADPATELCLLTPEQTEGPFYLPLELLREDVTEDREGLPLRLRIAVADVTSCLPLANAAVDIWHCDAQGYYSGVNARPGGNAAPEADGASRTFLRGIQLTNDEGIAEFTTIYPGWYSGRAVHIHMKVHVDGEAQHTGLATPAGTEIGTYEGGHVAHTGQLYFDDAISDQVFADVAAYAGRDNSQRVRNEQDGILRGMVNEPGFVMTLTPVTEGALADGFVGEITVGVDPDA